jgi:hypothetical protein
MPLFRHKRKEIGYYSLIKLGRQIRVAPRGASQRSPLITVGHGIAILMAHLAFILFAETDTE